MYIEGKAVCESGIVAAPSRLPNHQRFSLDRFAKEKQLAVEVHSRIGGRHLPRRPRQPTPCTLPTHSIARLHFSSLSTTSPSPTARSIHNDCLRIQCVMSHLMSLAIGESEGAGVAGVKTERWSSKLVVYVGLAKQRPRSVKQEHGASRQLGLA